MICQACQFDHEDLTQCDCGAALCPFCKSDHECNGRKDVAGGAGGLRRDSGTPALWPPQERGLAEYRAAVAAGEKMICITAPCGGGKTRIMQEITQEAAEHYQRVAIYTHRKLLLGQTSTVFDTAGIDHGIMAAGHDPALLRDVQVASVQTVKSRVYDKERWELHPADIVLIDEAHANVNPTMLQIIADHRDQGAVIVGFTATPVGLGGIYEKLIVAGTNSELRACGALVPCDTYSISEPDLKNVRRDKVGEYTVGGVTKAIMLQTIVGLMRDNWRKLNPDGKPTILFAPGVPESRWCAEDFQKHGITAAHIDAKTLDSEREDIIEGSREGRIKIVCNRFVLREGIDMPGLAHCIMATSFGAPSNYLQAGGRFLRTYPGLDRVILQDHGGHWWQPGFGSLNADRHWTLEDTDRTITSAAMKKREAGEIEPIRCPKCGGIRMTGRTCPFCGHEHKLSVRCVIQKNGELKHVRGRAVKKKDPVDQDESRWKSCLYAAANARRPMTFDQAAGMFYQKHKYRPPGGLKNMPTGGNVDWQRHVGEVCPWFVRKRKRQPA